MVTVERPAGRIGPRFAASARYRARVAELMLMVVLAVPAMAIGAPPLADARRALT